jgi:hypothetical protein
MNQRLGTRYFDGYLVTIFSGRCRIVCRGGKSLKVIVSRVLTNDDVDEFQLHQVVGRRSAVRHEIGVFQVDTSIGFSGVETTD